MVSRKEYQRKPESYWKGKQVRTLCSLRNSLAEIPKGTICTITHKGGGFSLKTEPCKRCGISFSIRKVSPEDVMLITEGNT